jgi:head-tail adaptor
VAVGPVEPGKRDRAVTIQQLAESQGGSGFPKPTWSTLASPVWMEKRPVGGQERFDADQTTARYDTRWILGWRTDMDPDTVDVPKKRRLSYGGRFHDIVVASEIGRRDGIELLTLTSAKTA